MFTSLLRSTGIIETLEPIFSRINSENWDQKIGIIKKDDVNLDKTLKPRIKCCVGVHISYFFDKVKVDKNGVEIYFYGNGEDYVIDEIKNVYPEMTYKMIYALFYCSGSSKEPFSSMDWNKHPSEVLKRMMFIETMPPSCFVPPGYEKHLSYYDLPGVQDWLNMERDKIERCIKQKNRYLT